jgi:hypothetical protein
LLSLSSTSPPTFPPLLLSSSPLVVAVAVAVVAVVAVVAAVALPLRF